MRYNLSNECDGIIIRTECGNTVKINFEKEDNTDVVDAVLNNLMLSYEKRIYG